MCVVTEAWLDKNSDEVNAWISTCELTKHGYCLNAISRETGDGGLAIIYKREYRVKKLYEYELQSFQFAKWRVSLTQKAITLNAIYHPPYSKKHPITNSVFLNELTDKLSDLAIENNTDSIILEDLNIHLNDEQSYDTELLNDTINSLGYKQHVSFHTHTAGHILDAVITKFDSDLILKCIPGKFISDHRAVICYLKCHKERPKKQVQSVRRWNKELDQLYNDFSKIDLPNEESTSIDTLVEHFEYKLKLCLDKYAPLEQKEYVSRRKFPWYNEEIRTQKQKVRRN